MTPHDCQRRTLGTAATAVAVAVLALAAEGCGSAFDGSATFNDAHPEYQNRPAYFDHSVGGTAAHESD